MKKILKFKKQINLQNLKPVIIFCVVGSIFIFSTPTVKAWGLFGSGYDQSYSDAKKYINKQKISITDDVLVVDVKKQSLLRYYKGTLKEQYDISTSKKGIGQIIGSRKTPFGLHRVSEKIGEGTPHYGVFKGRKFIGKVWDKKTPRHKHKRDYIVTRILRLEGLEKGINKGFNNKGLLVDSQMRAIYIHGTTMEWKLGHIATIGCVHLSSEDIVKLFNKVPVGTLVLIR